MSSPEGAGNIFHTPESSPDATEADLRALEKSLANFRGHLDETVQYFDEHFDHYWLLDDNVFDQIAELHKAPTQVSENTTQPKQASSQRHQPNQAITGATNVNKLIRFFEPNSNPNPVRSTYFTSDLPLFRVHRSLSGSLSSQGRLSSMSLLNGATIQPEDSMGTENALEEDSSTQGELTSEWAKFEQFARAAWDKVQLDVTKLKEQLNNPELNQSTAFLNASTQKVHRWRAKLTELDSDAKSLACTITVNRALIIKLNADIEDLTGDLDLANAIIDEWLTAARESTDPKHAFVEAIKDGLKDGLKSVGSSPTVSLPSFDGRDTTLYKAFRANFEFVIGTLQCPEELWATHLVSCLEGPAKEYIGAADKWFGKYNELWNVLEDKYANRWNLSTDTIHKFFSNQPTDDEPEAIKKFFYEQIDNLASLIALEQSAEEIGVNHLLRSLPVYYRNILRDGLRVVQPGKKKAAFSVGEIRKVFNDTIGVLDEEEDNKNKSTLSFKAHTDKYRNKKGKKQGNQAPKNQTSDDDQDTQAHPTQKPNQPSLQNYAQSGNSDARRYRDDQRPSRYDRQVAFHPDVDDKRGQG